MRQLKGVDLFSGIGGASLAMEYAGIQVVGHCEIKPFCQKVLLKHWPNVPLTKDIFKTTGDEFGEFDILHASFPCQPFSTLGKRRCKNDERFIWSEVLRFARHTRPKWIVAENVVEIIGVAGEDVCFSLETIDYDVQTIVLPAILSGSPQLRYRTFFVANSRSFRCPSFSEIQFQEKANGYALASASECSARYPRDVQYLPWDRIKSALFRVNDGLSRELDKHQWPGMRGEKQVVPPVERITEGSKQRLEALGNCVVPYQILPIFMCIVEIERMLEELGEK